MNSFSGFLVLLVRPVKRPLVDKYNLFFFCLREVEEVELFFLCGNKRCRNTQRERERDRERERERENVNDVSKRKKMMKEEVEEESTAFYTRTGTAAILIPTRVSFVLIFFSFAFAFVCLFVCLFLVWWSVSIFRSRSPRKLPAVVVVLLSRRAVTTTKKAESAFPIAP